MTWSISQNGAKHQKKKILKYRKKTINNFIISECVIKKSDKTLGLALIKDNKNLYRFSITSDKKYFDNYKKQFFEMVYSFGKVATNPSILNIEPPKIKVLKNSPKKGFIENVVKKSSLQKKFSKDIFKTINGMDDLETSQKIKTIY